MQAALSYPKDPDFSSKSHCLISPIPCSLHFTITPNTVNFKALKTCLYQGPPAARLTEILLAETSQGYSPKNCPPC